MTGHSCHKEGETQTSDCRDQYSCCWAGFRGCIVTFEADFLKIVDSDGKLIGGGTACRSFIRRLTCIQELNSEI